MDHPITPRVPCVVGITGAGGTPYPAAGLRALLDAGGPAGCRPEDGCGA
jgi:hypothetical protein